MSAQQELIEDLHKLNHIAETLNRSVDVRSTLKSALAQLVELMELETGWIFTQESSSQDRWWGKGYVLAAHHNLPPAMDLENPRAWDKGCDCQTLCNKGALDEAYNEVRCSRLAGVTGDRRGLAVHASTPLRSGDNVLGILNVAAPAWDAFSPRSLALLTNVGGQMGIALERARLFDLLQERRIHEQAALLDLSNQLLSRQDLDDLMTFLVEEVQRLLQVDACALLLPGPNLQHLYFRAAVGWRSDPVGNGYRVPADERSGSGTVMRTQKPLVFDYEQIASGETWSVDWLEAEAFKAAAIVPLIVAGHSIGVLVIETRRSRRFEESEIRFLQLMANQAAIAIEKTRLHEEELQRYQMEEELAIGRQIQLSMLPAACPTIPGWDFASLYEAARQIGGDFYDFFALPDDSNRLGLVIADVSDKGIPAALFMALSRTTIRNTALRGRPPAEALMWANRFIQEDSQSSMFLTAFYGDLDTDSGRLIYANAGHNRPLWWQAASGEFHELTARGVALGVLTDIDLEERELVMAPGDVIVFYTDGITEAVNESLEEFGRARLRKAVATAITGHPGGSAQDIVNAIMSAVKAFTGDTAQYDDLTLLVVKRNQVEG